MIQLITDRTNADVNRANEINKKVYSAWASAAANATGSSAVIDPVQIAESTLTDQEFAEWLSGLKGAYNYSDLNRVESAVAELSEHLQMNLFTKTDWGMWDVPTQTDMSRYVSNLQKVKEKYGANVEIPAAMNNLTHESANDIEKMLSESFRIKDSSDVWEKHSANVKYDWKYTRDNNHSSIGTVGDGVIAGVWVDDPTDASGLVLAFPASQTIRFNEKNGFYMTESDYTRDPQGAVGRYVGDGARALRVTSTPENRFGSIIYTYTYKVAGYATREWAPYCSIGLYYYGYFLFPKGTLPQGTLLEGSYEDGYCYMLDANGSYYYYKLR